MPSEATRLPGLDALRVTGALLVLFAHGGYFLFSAWPEFAAYQYAGWIGTEIFFALTGFLVMREVLALPAGNLRESGRYTAWRLFRILPLFWLALLANVLLAHAAHREVPSDAWRYALLVQNVASPHPAFFGEAWNLPLIVLASLFLPGLALGAAAFAKPRKVMWAMLAVLLLVGIALRAEWILQGAARWDEDVRKVVIARLDAVAYGAMLALSLERLARMRGAMALLAIVGLGLATAYFFFSPRDADFGAKLWSFCAAGVATAAACVALCAQGRANRPLARLARWVYPLYLVNMPLLHAFALIGFGQSMSASSSVLRFAAWMLASVALAALVHYLLERPMLEWGRRVIKPAASGASSR